MEGSQPLEEDIASLVLREDADGIATLTLNRAEKRNALNVDMFLALDRHLAALEGSAGSISAVILRAAGPVFCAGADVGKQLKPPYRHFQTATITRLARLPQPVVAVVHGPCFTGGMELILAADLILAAEAARFADTHGAFALAPGWGLSQRLPRRIGEAKAREMMLLGRTYSGREAEAMGLANLCLPDRDFEQGVSQVIDDLRKQSPHSLLAYKKLFLETQDMPLAGGIAYEAAYNPGAGPDFEERRNARLRK